MCGDVDRHRLAVLADDHAPRRREERPQPADREAEQRNGGQHAQRGQQVGLDHDPGPRRRPGEREVGGVVGRRHLAGGGRAVAGGVLGPGCRGVLRLDGSFRHACLRHLSNFP
jgi:hypothetical protein